jgi:site-specific DNA-methyltransferase (adenine-specific)
MKINKIYHDDFLNNTLSDGSVQLIIADPPYFEVKGEFDFTFENFDAYLQTVEIWTKEFHRLLSDNGTLLFWGNSKKIAYSQIIIDKYFNLLNSCVWEKYDSIQSLNYSIELSRALKTHNERLLIYDKNIDMTGLEKINEIYIKPLNPFSKYLNNEFNKAKVTRKEISKLFPSKSGGLTGCVSNWLNGDNVITKEQYLKIRQYLNGEYLRKEYEDLRKKYEDLRKKYEDLRRPFNNVLKLEEVLKYSQQSNVTKKYDHPTKKPERLTRDLIECCSRPDDLVFVPFAGSGTECAMSRRAKRNFIGFDICKEYVEMSNKRVRYIEKTPTLF